jgi:hypothetical protein
MGFLKFVFAWLLFVCLCKPRSVCVPGNCP